MSHTTISTVPRLISQVLSVYEVDARAIFEEAGIALDDSGNTEPRILMSKMPKLWQLAVEATSNPHLGLVAASIFQPAYLKCIGLAWMASESLAQGLERFVAQSQLINTSMKLAIVEQDDQWIIHYQSQQLTTMKISAHRCAIELGVGFFLKMFRLAAGKNIPATGVYFGFDVADDDPAYEEHFQCPVHANHSFNGIAFSKVLLNEQLPTHDPESVHLNEMAVNQQLKSMTNSATSEKVMKLIADMLPTGCPTEETIAYQLHTSKRTLQRKLSDEKSSFGNLLISVRLVLAKQQLTLTDHSITHITYQLGYSSPSTFARAFKKQTELSPIAYRQSHQVK